jgi:hypothetical protein
MQQVQQRVAASKGSNRARFPEALVAAYWDSDLLAPTSTESRAKLSCQALPQHGR